VLFAIHLGWLPAGGFEEVGAGYTGLAHVLDVARQRRAWRTMTPVSPSPLARAVRT
jgi:hypothetical protein